MDVYDEILSVFYANEYLIKILPTYEAKTFEEHYKINIDTYQTTAFFFGSNSQGYEIFISNLKNYFAKYGKLDFEKVYLNSVIPSSLGAKLNNGDKHEFLYKFLMALSKRTTPIILANLKIYCDLFAKKEFNEEKIKSFRKNLQKKIKQLAAECRNQLYTELTLEQNGENPQQYVNLMNDQNIIEQLRKQLEEADYTILRLKQEIEKLKAENDD